MNSKIFVLMTILFFCGGTVLAADTHFTGGTDADWSKSANWDNGVPSGGPTGDNALIDQSADAVIAGSAVASVVYIDAGNTLTIGSTGSLTLGHVDFPALWIGATGDAIMILDGGTLTHGEMYGGDAKAGMAEGSTVNIEIRSGSTWTTRDIRLGEAGLDENWPAGENVVHSTTNVLQTGGTVDLQTVRENVGELFIPYSSGATATYTMNDGSLLCSHIFLAYNGSVNESTQGTFNLNGGSVDVSNYVSVGFAGGGGYGSGSSITTHADINQTGGSLTVHGDLYVAQGFKQGTYEISGGDLTVGGTFANGVDGLANFKVVGSGASSIGFDSYTQNDISKFEVEIDAIGITVVDVNDIAVFDANALLEVSLADGVSVSVPTQYTLMSAVNGITDNGIQVVGPDCAYVDYQIVSGKHLVVTYYPTADIGRCGVETPVCTEPPAMDFDGNCIVDSGDIAILAESWLDCNLEPPTACLE